MMRIPTKKVTKLMRMLRFGVILLKSLLKIQLQRSLFSLGVLMAMRV